MPASHDHHATACPLLQAQNMYCALPLCYKCSSSAHQLANMDSLQLLAPLLQAQYIKFWPSRAHQLVNMGRGAAPSSLPSSFAFSRSISSYPSSMMHRSAPTSVSARGGEGYE